MLWQNAFVACENLRPTFFFVNGKKANEPGSQWCFDHNLELNCPNEGWLILDILKDKQIGGLEFVDKIRS